MTRQGWFSDIDPDTAIDDTFRWQACLQLEGWCPTIDVWFDTKEDCDTFIRDEVVGKPALDSPS
jgi:hypothetical protein